MIRVSEDLPNLRRHFNVIVRKGERATAPEAYMRWLSHLLTMYQLADSSPEIVGVLSYAELRGLAMIREVLRESGKNSQSCPRCKRPATGMFDCEHCGARLR